MTSGSSSGGNRDDDALGWAGDDDPTLLTGDGSPAADDGAAAPSFDTEHVPDGWTVSGPTAAVEAEIERRRAATPMSSVTLIALGVFGGVYLLYTVGWFISVTRIDNPLTEVLARFMFDLGLWLAVAAAPLWFGATIWLTSTRPRARIGFLLLGVLLLVPLPIVLAAGGNA